MKPNFALNLAHDGIGLLHRAKTGWNLIGTVALDDDDMAAQLEMLRKTATDLDSSGLTTKILIPNSQILYTEVQARGPDGPVREANIRKALEGLTPYAVKDLVFDWRANGDQVHLAVVARDTLGEAETFARDHRFNPVSFASLPEPGIFPGEPFFGPAPGASALLARLGPVEPDDTAPLDPGTAAPEPDKAAAPKEPAQQPKDEPAKAAANPTGPAGKKTPDAAKTDTAASDKAAKPVAPEEPAISDTPASDTPDKPGKTPIEPLYATFASRRGPLVGGKPAAPASALAGVEPRIAPLTDSQPKAAPQSAGAAGSKAAEPAVLSPAIPDAPDAKPDTPAEAKTLPKAPAALRKSDAAQNGKHAPAVLSPKAEARTGKSAKRGFSSRLGRPIINFGPKQDATPTANPTIPDRKADSAVGDMPLSGGTAAAQETEAKALTVFGARRTEPDTSPLRRPLLGLILTLVLLAILAAVAVWSMMLPDNGTDTGDAVDIGVQPLTSEIALPVLPGPGSADAPATTGIADAAPETAAPSILAEPVDEAVALSDPAPEAAIDPAADAGPEEEALADGMAAEDITDESAPEVLAVAAPDDVELPTLPVDPEIAALPAEPADAAPIAAAEPVVADGAETAIADDTPSLPSDPVTELIGTDDGAAERVAAQLLEELTPEVAQRRYASTGVWVFPPQSPDEPGADRLDDLYVASIDPAIAGQDAVALPNMSSDKGLLPPVPPAAAGTTFDLDDRGLVRASPDGALSPDGILVYSGTPTRVPAPRPSDIVETPTPEADAANDAARDALSRIRPRPRPSDLSETNEKATLGGRTRVQLAALKPRPRPEGLVQAVAAAVVTETAPDFSGASGLAVAASRQPRSRPSNIAQIAAASVRTPAPVGTSKATSKAIDNAVGKAIEEADDEPVVEVASAAKVVPKIPTKASVAKNATVANAINLSKINLIGVYGSPSQRRALVRMSNGKYVKVKVGDRIDGGKVAAIGETELTYVKSGRQIKLAMPKT